MKYELAIVATESQLQWGYNSVAIIELVSGGQYSRRINNKYTIHEVIASAKTKEELREIAEEKGLKIQTVIY